MKLVENYLDKVQTEIVPAYLALSVAGLMLTAIRTYKDYFTKNARRCSDLPMKEKSLCMLRAKLQAKNAQLNRLKSLLGQCSKTKKPDECELKIKKKVDDVSNDIKFFNDRFNDLKKQAQEVK